MEYNLSSGSHKKIKFNCDICGNGVEQEYRNFIKSKDGAHLCRRCRNKKTMEDAKIREIVGQKSKKRWECSEFKENVGKKISEKKKQWWNKNKEQVKKKPEDYKEIFSSLKDKMEKLGFRCICDLNYFFEHKKIKFRCPEDRHDVVYTKKQMETVTHCFFCKQEKRWNLF